MSSGTHAKQKKQLTRVKVGRGSYNGPSNRLL